MRGAAFLSVLLAVLQAEAANIDEAFLVLSNGTETCGAMLADNQPALAADVEWVLGYISGLNRHAPPGERYAGSSFRHGASVSAWLQNYCQTHALDSLAQAADALRAEFLRREAR